MNAKDIRRGKFADRPRQGFYPMWGIDDPYRETNAHELYRYGEPGLLTRYIVPPSDVVDKRRVEAGKKPLGDVAYKLLKPGLAVEDVVLALLAVALLLLMSYPMGVALDGYLEMMGW